MRTRWPIDRRPAHASGALGTTRPLCSSLLRLRDASEGGLKIEPRASVASRAASMCRLIACGTRNPRRAECARCCVVRGDSHLAASSHRWHAS
ncbi:hypothetical protein MTO96_013848 [Rhipicephalus appendiculatus]